MCEVLFSLPVSAGIVAVPSASVAEPSAVQPYHFSCPRSGCLMEMGVGPMSNKKTVRTKKDHKRPTQRPEGEGRGAWGPSQKHSDSRAAENLFFCSRRCPSASGGNGNAVGPDVAPRSYHCERSR